MHQYKIFESKQFVGREEEIVSAERTVRERAAKVIIFEGDRGVGKTSLLLSLFKRLNDAGAGVKPFFLSLSEYQADEFDGKNIWIKAENFTAGQITALLDQIAEYYRIERVPTSDPDTQKEYLARGLTQLPGEHTAVLFVDSIYECDTELFEKLEKYLLVPFISSERSMLILSGRGGAPIWSHPALRSAKIQKLHPFEKLCVRDQLEKMASPHLNDYDKIAEYSAGYPLTVRLLGEAGGAPEDELDGALDVLLGETLLDENFASSFSEEQRRDIRLLVEKLALVSLPFRKIEVENYLFKDDLKRSAKTTALIETLLRSHIMRYENGGYQLNNSIADPIRKYLTLSKTTPKLEEYVTLLKENCNELAKAYPAASSRYNDLVQSIKPYEAHLR